MSNTILAHLCLSVWSRVELRGWSRHEMGIRLVVEGQRKKEWSKRTWKRQAEEESVKVGLRRKDALCCSKWSVGIKMIAAGVR